MHAATRVSKVTHNPELRRAVFHELTPLIDDDCNQNWEDSVAIYEACRQQPKADPWLLHMLAGRAYVSRAWHHRGGKWASEVTPDGWRLFGENLQKAAHEYTEALTLHPESPEAPAYLITVAMAGESDRTPQEWCAMAMAAQIDYLPTFRKMRWALRPRWCGSHTEMYEFGCQCADTRRYDTQVPFVLLQAINNIDNEMDFSGQVWRQEGVYARVKEVLEGMANEPSRADHSGVYPQRSSVMSIHAALAERAGAYADARQLVDELGDRLDRRIFDSWCTHPEMILTKIYIYSGKGNDAVREAWQTLRDAPKPFTKDTLEKMKSLYQKALTADDNERSQAYCRSWLNDLDGRLAFGEGKWFEKKFDPGMLGWEMADGTWSMEDEHTAVGHARNTISYVNMRPLFYPLLPLEIEFDVEARTPEKTPLNLGLFVPGEGQAELAEETSYKFYIRTHDNLAGIDIAGKAKTVPCELKQVNRIRVQLADGHAVLFVNDQFCLEHHEKDFHPPAVFDFGCHTYLGPATLVCVGNVRFRYWEPPEETPQDRVPPEKEMQPEQKTE